MPRQMQQLREGTEGLQTHRWIGEKDSNRRSPRKRTTLFETAPFGNLLDQPNVQSSRPARRSKPRAGSASGRLSALRYDIHSPGCSLDEEGRRSMLRCSPLRLVGDASAQIVPVGMPADGHG